MTRPILRRYYPSIEVCLFILTVTFIATQAAHAQELSENSLTTIAHADSDVTDSMAMNNISNEASPQRYTETENEIRCLALNIYFEARSESEQGQHAVGHVVMNRVANRHYPDTICGVVQQGGEQRLNRCQFSWWCDGRSDKPLNQAAWHNALQQAYSIYFGHSKDPTDGALWYHADYVNPYWSDTLTLGKKIGQHVFYLQKKQPKYALNQD